jgi:hypothetical protein
MFIATSILGMYSAFCALLCAIFQHVHCFVVVSCNNNELYWDVVGILEMVRDVATNLVVSMSWLYVVC